MIGIAFENAPFEADVAIAKNTNCTVVSGDSDYFFHRNVSVVAKLNSNKLEVLVWKKSIVLQKLAISSDQMVALGVVSGNDYARNIPSKLLLTLDFGLSKNLDVIKSLKLKSDVRKVVGAYASAIMEKNKKVVVPKDHFEPALQIFDDLTESTPSVSTLSEFKSLKTSIENRKHELFSKLEDDIKSKSSRQRSDQPGDISNLNISKKHYKFSPAEPLGQTRYASRTITPKTKFDHPFISVNSFELLPEDDEIEEDANKKRKKKAVDPEEEKKKKDAKKKKEEEKKEKGEEEEKPKKTKKRRRGNTAPHAKGSMNGSFGEDALQKKEKKKRENSEETTETRRLKGHLTNAWHIGVLSAKLKNFYDATRMDQTIKNSVKSMNILIRHTQKAANYVLDNILSIHPDKIYLLHDMLGCFDNDDGNAFWGGIKVLT